MRNSLWLAPFMLCLAGCQHAMQEQKTIQENLVKLRVGEYFEADWSSYGFYDDGGAFEHQYGGPDSGYYAYGFHVSDDDPERLTVRARLSAESSDRGRPEEVSDVTLVINGIELGTQRVQADDQRGQIYEWVVDQATVLRKIDLKTGKRHVLKFWVKDDAKAKHGLCLYGESLEEIGQGTSIEIRTMKHRF